MSADIVKTAHQMAAIQEAQNFGRALEIIAEETIHQRGGILTLLNDEEWAKWSDREIARRCAVDHKTVAALRPRVSGEIPQMPPVRTVQRGGAVYEQKIENIGRKLVEPAPEPIRTTTVKPII